MEGKLNMENEIKLLDFGFGVWILEMYDKINYKWLRILLCLPTVISIFCWSIIWMLPIFLLLFINMLIRIINGE